MRPLLKEALHFLEQQPWKDLVLVLELSELYSVGRPIQLYDCILQHVLGYLIAY